MASRMMVEVSGEQDEVEVSDEQEVEPEQENEGEVVE